MITDSAAVKPEDWLEDEPDMIPDPEAEKPEEWDVSDSVLAQSFICCILEDRPLIEAGRGRW